MRLIAVLAAGLGLLASSPVLAGATPLASTLDEVERDVIISEDIEEIKRLTYVYGYLRDRLGYRELLDLFTEDATFDFANGQYVGKESIARLFYSERFNVSAEAARAGDLRNVLNEHVMMQPVITVGADGKSAFVRAKEVGTIGVFEQSQTYTVGVYENRYVKADGRWKIAAIKHCYRMEMPYAVGVFDLPERPAYTPVPTFYPEDPEGPDRQSSYACHTYPHTGVNPPFHYEHPVTGERIQKP